MNEMPSDFYGFGSSFPAFITVAPGFCNSLLVVLLTMLMQFVFGSESSWNSVPGDTNISLTLTLSPFFAFDYYLHQSETRSLGSQCWEGC